MATSLTRCFLNSICVDYGCVVLGWARKVNIETEFGITCAVKEHVTLHFTYSVACECEYPG